MGARMNNGNKNPPKTIEEVGIHIGYMSDNLADIKDILKESPTRKEMDEVKRDLELLRADYDQLKEKVALKETVEALEEKAVTKKEFGIGVGVITTALTIAVTVLSLLDKVKL